MRSREFYMNKHELWFVSFLKEMRAPRVGNSPVGAPWTQLSESWKEDRNFGGLRNNESILHISTFRCILLLTIEFNMNFSFLQKNTATSEGLTLLFPRKKRPLIFAFEKRTPIWLSLCVWLQSKTPERNICRRLEKRNFRRDSERHIHYKLNQTAV